MAPELRDPSDPGEWLRRARSNLARCRADRRLSEVLLEDLCFDAQQAAEKAVKAVLVQRRARFRKTHDLSELLDLVAASGLDVPPEVATAKRLTTYAVGGRYPGTSEDVTDADYDEALRTAEAVVAWAEKTVGAS